MSDENLLPTGTRIRFPRTLNAPATGDHPALTYANAGETGEITGHGCAEGYWVTSDSWPHPFGARRGEFEPLPQPAAPEEAQSEDERAFDDAINLDNWSVTTSFNFLCNDCRLDGRLTTLTTGLADQTAAATFAEERGWSREGKSWRCPQCAHQSDLEDQAEAQYLQ